MNADLHVHSTASDGTLPPEALVSLAAQRHVDVLAIADHDTVDGVARAVEAGKASGVRVVPAVELSAASGDRSVHILGYFVDIESSALAAELHRLREARVARATGIVEALTAQGFSVSVEQVLALSAGGAVGRTHVARALVDVGAAASVSDAFERFVGRGKPFYRAKALREPADVIQLILAAGGIPVLAHPGVPDVGDLVDELVGYGLAGIEAFHADHTDMQRTHFAELAEARGLLVTGGTDFHSPDAPNADLGSVDLPDVAIAKFLAADPGASIAHDEPT